MEMLKYFQTSDALLLAIDEEYVEGVELLLEHEERIWKVRKRKIFEVGNIIEIFSPGLSTPGRSRTPCEPPTRPTSLR